MAAVLLGAEYPELNEKSALIDGILTAEEELALLPFCGEFQVTFAELSSGGLCS